MYRFLSCFFYLEKWTVHLVPDIRELSVPFFPSTEADRAAPALVRLRLGRLDPSRTPLKYANFSKYARQAYSFVAIFWGGSDYPFLKI